MKKDWWQNLSAEQHLRQIAYRSNDETTRREVEFVQEHVPLQSGSAILDLACGNGRHSKILSSSYQNVYSLDYTRDLLKAALDTTFKGDLLIQGDMLSLPFRNSSFDLVISMWQSLGYFSNETENLKVFGEISRTLKTGGYLFVEVNNPIRVIIDLAKSGKIEADETLQFRSTTQEASGASSSLKKFNVSTFRYESRKLYNGPELSTEVVHDMRYYTLPEIHNIFKDNSLTIMDVFGSFTGEAYGPMSERLIVVAQKH